jgi:DHA1 family tetracycline resistance protein-like MFS transporter
LDKDRSRKIFVIFLVVFIDLLGFGIMIPLLPTFSQNVLHMHETTIGLVAGIFSLMQFIFNPFWGRLSDIYGRKPIIMFSLAGNVVSYILLGLVLNGTWQSVEMLFIARALAGFFSANIGAAMAYISDITPPQERSKGMGLIGAAFGLGFVFGPFMGGVLAKRFSFGAPVFVSSALSLVALLLTIFILKESLPEEFRHKDKKAEIKPLRALKELVNALKHPNVGFLIILYFIVVFSVANIYATFQLYAESKEGFSFDVEQVSYLFAFFGLTGALVQGVLIRPLLKRFDERKLLIAGNIIMAVGLATIPFSHHIIGWLLVSSFLTSFGNGLNLPITLSLVSKFTSRDEQGEILGLNQSLASFARFLGPSWGGFVYQFLGFAAPFLTGGIFMVFASVLSLKLLNDKFDLLKHNKLKQN